MNQSIKHIVKNVTQNLHNSKQSVMCDKQNVQKSLHSNNLSVKQKCNLVQLDGNVTASSFLSSSFNNLTYIDSSLPDIQFECSSIRDIADGTDT